MCQGTLILIMFLTSLPAGLTVHRLASRPTSRPCVPVRLCCSLSPAPASSNNRPGGPIYLVLLIAFHMIPLCMVLAPCKAQCHCSIQVFVLYLKGNFKGIQCIICEHSEHTQNC